MIIDDEEGDDCEVDVSSVKASVPVVKTSKFRRLARWLSKSQYLDLEQGMDEKMRSIDGALGPFG